MALTSNYTKNIMFQSNIITNLKQQKNLRTLKKAAKNQPLSKKQTTLSKRKEEKVNTENKTNQDVRDYKQEI